MIFVPIKGSKTKKIEVRLDRDGKEEQLVVVFAGRRDDQIDLDLSSIHRAPATKGRIAVRGILRERASARVRGLIKIEKKARGSEDFFEERTLLLGGEARVEVLPYLEIEADDVRASHSAATGVIDQDQLFYLRSRGLSEKQATDLLVAGFLDGLVAGQLGKKLASEAERVKAYALG